MFVNIIYAIIIADAFVNARGPREAMNKLLERCGLNQYNYNRKEEFEDDENWGYLHVEEVNYYDDKEKLEVNIDSDNYGEVKVVKLKDEKNLFFREDKEKVINILLPANKSPALPLIIISGNTPPMITVELSLQSADWTTLGIQPVLSLFGTKLSLHLTRKHPSCQPVLAPPSSSKLSQFFKLNICS